MISRNQSEDFLLGDDKYFCETCKKKVDMAVKKTTYSKLPVYLMITLCRFYFDVKTKRRRKLFNYVDVPDDLDIIQTINEKEVKKRYYLKGVIIHKVDNPEYFY